LNGNSRPYVAPEPPEGVINLSDPDSRVMRTHGTPAPAGLQRAGRGQRSQVSLAAEISIAAANFGHLGPMLDTNLDGIRRQGVEEAPEVVITRSVMSTVQSERGVTTDGSRLPSGADDGTCVVAVRLAGQPRNRSSSSPRRRILSAVPDGGSRPEKKPVRAGASPVGLASPITASASRLAERGLRSARSRCPTSSRSALARVQQTSGSYFRGRAAAAAPPSRRLCHA
jgi:hypothetical protein